MEEFKRRMEQEIANAARDESGRMILGRQTLLALVNGKELHFEKLNRYVPSTFQGVNQMLKDAVARAILEGTVPEGATSVIATLTWYWDGGPELDYNVVYTQRYD